MTKVKEQAIGLLQSMPDDKVIYILDILRGLKGLADYESRDQSDLQPPLSAMGILSEYANVDLIPLEEGAWRRATVKKHAPS